ncbi:MAG: hypothetical protein JXA11_08170, partial [Phycisphaerae bacterium]|nr:hypothetical protein [Phycisphaerae bacterium]
ELEDAGSYGTSMAMMIMRVVLVDYFLSKEDPYLVPDTHPTGSAGGTILFDERDSYDPDCISWNNNATYTQIYGKKTTGMQYFLYDFDDDGDWDYTAYTDSLYYPVNSLISMGIPTNQWSQYRKASVDDEGKWVYAYDSMYLSTGVPEPASLSLLAIGGLALLRRGSGQALRRRQ